MEHELTTHRVAARSHLEPDGEPRIVSSLLHSLSMPHGSRRTSRQARCITSVSIRARNSVCVDSSPTPPGYNPKASHKYPVLFLLPGTPGDETEWTNAAGSADVIFDNLIAEGRMPPAIVVMHASDVNPAAPTRRGDDNLRQFETILVSELSPLVKQRYPVKTDANSWALAGVSLGGEFAMAVGLRHPELFGNLGSLSGSLVPRGDEEENLPSMDQRFGPALARPGVSKNYKSVWIGCGTNDNVCRGSRVFVQRLETAGITHTWREYEGAHQMLVFRRELIDFLQTLFR